ncbi:MAG: hypothetical protein ACHQNE_01680 [Candidatus Kapaibacterium sp.]
MKHLISIGLAFSVLPLAACKKSDEQAANERLDSLKKAHKADSLFQASLDSMKGTEGYKKIHDSVMRSLGLKGWRYSSDTDNMRNEVTEFAHVESDNELNFDFPYQGGSTGTLTLRRTGKKVDVILDVSKGQFNTTPEGIKVSAKFDNLPVQRFTGYESNNGRTDVIGIEPTNRFIDLLKKSSHVIIEAPFYESGNQQLTFSSDSLKW